MLLSQTEKINILPADQLFYYDENEVATKMPQLLHIVAHSGTGHAELPDAVWFPDCKAQIKLCLSVGSFNSLAGV